MKVKLICPVCGHEWQMSYFRWILKAPFHWILRWRDHRKTQCPHCGHKSWIAREK